MFDSIFVKINLLSMYASPSSSYMLTVRSLFKTLHLLHTPWFISSAEGQKGINAVQRCSVENQKSAITACTKSVAIAPFWFSVEHRWTSLTPFWLSADNMCSFTCYKLPNANYANYLYYILKCWAEEGHMCRRIQLSSMHLFKLPEWTFQIINWSDISYSCH